MTVPISRWVACPWCGGTAESLAGQLGCTNTHADYGEELPRAPCRRWDRRAHQAWAAAGYPAPGEVGSDGA